MLILRAASLAMDFKANVVVHETCMGETGHIEIMLKSVSNGSPKSIGSIKDILAVAGGTARILGAGGTHLCGSTTGMAIVASKEEGNTLHHVEAKFEAVFGDA